MAVNVGNIASVIEESGPLAIQIGAVLAALCFCNWVMLFFGLIFIFRSISAKKNSEKLGEDKESNVVSEQKPIN